MSSETVSLLPCPFCGGKPMLVHSEMAKNLFRYECVNCDAGPASSLGQVAASERWNQRFKPVASGTDEVIERIGEIVYRRHERGFILWPLVEGDRIKSELREALEAAMKE